jgi:hypothetical protein
VPRAAIPPQDLLVPLHGEHVALDFGQERHGEV